MRQPYRYYLGQPDDSQAREALASRIVEELKQWRETERMHPGTVTDPDRLWPLDRLPVVQAIQKYYIRTRRLPPELDALFAARLLSDPTCRERCKLIRKNSEWELRRADTDYLFAQGN